MRKPVVTTAIASLTFFAGCSSLEPTGPAPEAATGQSTLEGWRNCSTENCGRNFVSAYTTFEFVRLDSESIGRSPTVRVQPGRHWLEAHYSWGAGILTGMGNFRNYGFEFDFVADHQYTIRDVPSGCLVPASKHWVSPKVLRVEDRTVDGHLVVHEVKAMEYCTPSSSESGTCRSDSDCPSGTCTPFGGTTGFGLCGQLQ